MRFFPSADPKTFALSAVIIGCVLIDDLTANEQNSVGNWLILVGQVLAASSAQQQVIEERITGNTINTNGQNCKQQGDPYMQNPQLYNKKDETKDDITLIKNALDKMQKEINSLINEK